MPEILALPVVDGLHSYLDWMREMTLDAGEAEAPPPSSSATWLDYTDVYPRGHHTVAGNIKLMRGLYSPQLHNQRDILVYLPPSYASSARRYPVLYMHDGQNLFDGATSYAGEWYVDETLEGLGQPGDRGHRRRRPERGAAPRPTSTPRSRIAEVPEAVGEDYVEFLADTLKPVIDRDFRTLAGRESTAIMGSSLGGLISLYAILQAARSIRPGRCLQPGLPLDPERDLSRL